jgi:allantoicase
MSDFRKLVDLASERLGGRAIAANDEFFAPKANLLKESKPVFIEGKFTTRGKWMDGWETRRRRTPGYDWCVIRLGLPGVIRGAVVDTSYFKGNFPARFSLEACDLGGGPPYEGERARLNAARTQWTGLLLETPLAGDSQNEFAVAHDGRFTHLRLKIYPDGGVARLRVHGEAVPDRARMARSEIDLASVLNGARILQSSDEFFGVPLNLLMPGMGKNMGDGWETRRRRGPGHDWTIVKLGVPGTIQRVEVDTSHFKGNFPESCSIEACYSKEGDGSDAAQLHDWKELLPRTKLRAHSRHFFRGQLATAAVGPATHVRFNIYPDGGVSRLRLFGQAEQPQATKGIALLNELSDAEAGKALLDCCGSKKWAEEMLALRPFARAEAVFEAADRIWAALDPNDWLEAFLHHPPIGDSKAAKKQSQAARKWSSGEQSRAQQASDETRAQLAEANQAYHAKFGTVYLICATGKTAEEILASARARLANDPETERRIAAEEQRKITRLRLEKLLAS